MVRMMDPAADDVVDAVKDIVALFIIYVVVLVVDSGVVITVVKRVVAVSFTLSIHTHAGKM